MKTDKKISKSENPDWQRLFEVIKFTGMSTNAFALHIGLPRSENLYQIKKGNHGISKALAETINRLYPNFPVGWLLSGEAGSNTHQDADKLQARHDTMLKIPVYNRLSEGAKPAYHRYISEDFINGAQAAVVNKDEAANPKIPVGALVFVKPTDRFFPGKIYLIITKDHHFIRKIRESDIPDKIRLQAIDRQNFDDIVLSKSNIIQLYEVKKCLTDI